MDLSAGVMKPTLTWERSSIMEVRVTGMRYIIHCVMKMISQVIKIRVVSSYITNPLEKKLHNITAFKMSIY